jgi:cobalt-precorrin-7 (C5)-methyltransferase
MELFDNNIKATIHVGEELSYADESIIKGTVEEFKDKIFNNLSVVVIENMEF